MEYKIKGNAVEYMEERVIEAESGEEALNTYIDSWCRGELLGGGAEGEFYINDKREPVILRPEEIRSLEQGNTVRISDGIMIKFPESECNKQ